MSTTFTVTGSLTDERTVALDEALPMTSARVRVIVEPLPEPSSYAEVLATIRARQLRREHQPPTQAEVDGRIASERADWGE